MKYVAQVRDRRGRLRFQTAAHDTREQAVQAAFKNGPASARTCSTSEAFLDLTVVGSQMASTHAGTVGIRLISQLDRASSMSAMPTRADSQETLDKVR
jgi:hypothetical protein